MHLSRRCIPTVPWALAVALVPPAWSTDCTIAALGWSPDGTALHCTAGDSTRQESLRVDVATGAVTADTPRVADPSWNPVTQRVLCHDAFGVYEVPLDTPQPRPLVFLPAQSNSFLRALGCDTQGALLLWTIARDTGEHEFWRHRDGTLERIPGVATGAEALRWWDAKNVARPFATAGGLFVRSACVQRSHSGHRLCLERLGSDGGAAVFRLVLSAPGRTNVVLDRCVPNAQAVPADSSLAAVGLFEEPDAAGRSEVLSLWLSDFETATRLTETLLERPALAATRQRAWVHWLASTQFLWVDAVGQLWRVHTAPPRATVLVRHAASAGQSPATSRWVPPGDGEQGPPVRRADGSVAFVRHQRTAQGMRSEIWVAPPGAAARLLVPIWERVTPVAVP